MKTRELEEFDLHRVNRLIELERIPGFKLVPKDRAMLDEYREALRRKHGYSKEENETNAEVETPEEAPRNKRHGRKSAPTNEPAEPVADMEQSSEPVSTDPIEPETPEVAE